MKRYKNNPRLIIRDTLTSIFQIALVAFIVTMVVVLFIDFTLFIQLLVGTLAVIATISVFILMIEF